VIYQIVAIAVIAAAVWFLAHNTLENMRVRGIQSGFGFLGSPAGFDIGEMLINYDALDPYWKAFLVGILNTLRVAVIGIVLTTVLGTLLGIGRFSHNAIVRGLCYGYVELFRNIPVLLQLLLWYLVFTEILPDTNAALSVGSVFLSKGGLSFPVPIWVSDRALRRSARSLGLVLALFYRHWAMQQFERTGRVRDTFWPALALIFGMAFVGWLVGGAPTEWNSPKQGEVMVEKRALR